MKHHQRIAAAALLALGGGSLALAEEAATAVETPQSGVGMPAAHTTYETGTWQGTPWLSGGFGEGAREELLDRFADDFNLKLEFALDKGNYLGDVDVRITNTAGETVMEANSKGPWFMTRLPPGEYQATASGFGQSFDKQVSVPASGLNTVVFNGWDSANVPQ